MMQKLTKLTTRVLATLFAVFATTSAWAATIGDQLTFSSIEKVASATTKDGASSTVGFSVTIPASLDLPEGSKVTLQSIKFGRRSATRNYLVLSDDANAAMASTNRIDHSTADSGFGNVAWMQYDFNDLELTVGTTYPAHFRDNANGSAKNQGSDVNLMTYFGGYQVFAQSSFPSTRIMYYEVKCTVSYINASALSPNFRQLGTTANPEGWFTSWDGEEFSEDCKAIGPGDNVYVAEKDDSASRTPYKDYQAPEEFSFAIYTDASMVEPYEENKKPVLWTFGTSGAANLRLRKDMSSNKLQLVAGNGAATIASVEVAIPGGGYHLYTATFSTSGGISLTVDDDTSSTVSDSTACTRPASGMQIGGMYAGAVDGETQVKHMPIGALLGYDKVLADADIEDLAEDYPVVSSRTTMLSYADEGHKLYSGTMTSTQRIELDIGTLSIPSGSTLTIPSLRVGNNGSSKNFGIDLDGTLKISGTSTGSGTGQSGSGSIRGDVISNVGGVLLGEWTGNGTYNISGLLDAENNYVTICHDSSSGTFNVNGGTIKAKALQSKNNGRATINLTDGGTIEVAEVLSGAGSYTRNYGYGTLRYTGSATESLPINFNAGAGYATTLDPGANTLTLNAGVITGTGDVNVAPSASAGKVVFASLGSTYSGNITVSSGAAEIKAASGYTGSITANAPITIDNADAATIATLSGTANITKIGTGTLTITGTGTATGKMIVNNGSKLVLSGHEAKVGTGMFELKNAAATLDIIPGAGNTITLAPAFIVNSSEGGSSINVGPGEFVVASTGSSGYGHFGQSDINILNGGTMRLTKASLFGNNMYTTVTVNNGGLLAIDASQEMTRSLTLAGGTVTLANANPALVYKNNVARPINVTEDSEIRAEGNETVANPTIQMDTSGITFDVATSKTLTLNACIVEGDTAARQGNGITKTGAGILALNGANGSGYNYTGQTTVSAGTLLINATQSGSAYSLAAGTTIKFGTSANLSVPLLTLPASGTVTVDVSNLTLSGSGTTLMTFTTSTPSADDVASKMTVSGAVLRLEGSALKAYPVAVLKKANGDDVVFSSVQAAVNATATVSYYDYQYITVNLDGQTVNAVDMTLKVKYGAGVSSLTINSPYAEYASDGGVTDGESGITTYSLAPAATTYTWVATGEGVKNWTAAANWTYGSGTPATRYPTTCDSVVFNDGANVTLDSTMTVAGIAVNGAVSISGSAKSLNTSGNITGEGTLTLSDICLASVGAELTVSPSVNFTNDSELARVTSGKFILNGDITASGTFKSWDVAHTVNGDLSIASGVNMAIGTGLEVNGSTTFNGNFSKSQGGTLTLGNVRVAENTAISISNGSIAITGTVTIDPGVTLTIPSSGVTFSGASFVGSGRAVFTGALPPESLQTSFKDEKEWSGTVELKNYTETTDSFHIINLNNYGNNNSAVALNCVTSTMYAVNGTASYPPVTLKEIEIGEGGWSDWEDGSYSSVTMLYTAKLTGHGPLTVKTGGSGTVMFVGEHTFDGSVTMDSGTGKQVAFMRTSIAPAAVTAKAIVVDEGLEMSVASGKTWTANGGFVVNGTLNVNGTLASSHASKAVSGSGKVVFTGRLPSQTGAAWWKNANWTGKVEIKSYIEENAAYHIINLNNYGNVNSTVALNGVKSTMYAKSGDTNYPAVTLKEIEIGEGGWSDWEESSYGTDMLYTAKLTGHGPITVKSGGEKTVKFVGEHTFDGSVSFGDSAEKQVAFMRTSSDTLPTSVTAKAVIVAGRLNMSIASGKTWTAPGGVKIDGSLTVRTDEVETATPDVTPSAYRDGAQIETSVNAGAGTTTYSTSMVVSNNQASMGAVTVIGGQSISGSGGTYMSSLTINDGATLTYDPVITPIRVESAPVFVGTGKLKLAARYEGVTRGKFHLVSYPSSASVSGTLTNLVDDTSFSGDSYTVTEETVGSYKQLVLKVGDYDTNAKAVSIAQFGDSITEGIIRDGYRGTPNYRIPLMQLLEAYGYRPEARGYRSVGSTDANGVPADDNYKWHTGISAQRIYTGLTDGALRAGFMESIEAHLEQVGVTDIITLKIGTNDALGGETAGNMFEGWSNLVWKIVRMRPTSKIVVCAPVEIRKEGKEAHEGRAAELRTMIAAYVTKTEAEGGFPTGQVTMINGYAVVSHDDGCYLGDGVHPNWNGHLQLANGWLPAVTNAIERMTARATTGYTAQTVASAADAAELAAYRAGYVKLATFTNFNAKVSAWDENPYVSVNDTYKDMPMRRVAYFVARKTTTSPDTRYVWVDMDADETSGTTLAAFGMPTNAAVNGVVNNLHIYSNSSAIENVAPTVSGVRGTLMRTEKGVTMANSISTELAPNGPYEFDWNDSIDDTKSWGVMNMARIFDGATATQHRKLLEAQMLFDFNGFNTAGNNNALGIGNFAVHGQYDRANSTLADQTLNWTFNVAMPTMDATALETGVIEIWGKPAWGTIFSVY